MTDPKTLGLFPKYPTFGKLMLAASAEGEYDESGTVTRAPNPPEHSRNEPVRVTTSR